MSKQKIRNISITAIFTGLSVILYFLKFPLPFFPSFLKIQFSALPLVILGFALGPAYGFIALVAKTIICLPMSESLYVGDLADFIIGCGYILSTSFMYKHYKTKKGALVSLLVGCGVWILLGCVANYFILVPFYIETFMKANINNFVAACSVIPGININNYKEAYVFLAALPFNLLISVVVSFVTFIVYKKISVFLKTPDFKK